MKPSANALESLAQIKDLLKNQTQQIRAERGQRPVKLLPRDIDQLIRTIKGLCSVVETLSKQHEAHSKESTIATEAVTMAKRIVIEVENHYR